jgi:hypothetical protein
VQFFVDRIFQQRPLWFHYEVAKFQGNRGGLHAMNPVGNDKLAAIPYKNGESLLRQLLTQGSALPVRRWKSSPSHRLGTRGRPNSMPPPRVD